MPVNTFLAYARAMDQIIGVETLREIEVSVFPNLKRETQRDVRKKYEDMSGRSSEPMEFKKAFEEVRKWQMKK